MSNKNQKALVKKLNEEITSIQTQIDEEKYDESLLKKIDVLVQLAKTETNTRVERRTLYVKNLFLRRRSIYNQDIQLESLLAKLKHDKNFMRGIRLRIDEQKKQKDDDGPPAKERESKQEQKEREEKKKKGDSQKRQEAK